MNVSPLLSPAGSPDGASTPVEGAEAGAAAPLALLPAPAPAPAPATGKAAAVWGAATARPRTDLQSCYDKFAEPEELTGDSAYACEECTRRRAEERERLRKPTVRHPVAQQERKEELIREPMKRKRTIKDLPPLRKCGGARFSLFVVGAQPVRGTARMYTQPPCC